jgi:hypothetical protein
MNKTPEQVLREIQEACERMRLAGAPAVTELKIIRSEYLPAGTMVVAPDVYAMFQQVPGKQP